MKRKCLEMTVRGLWLPRSSPLPLLITPHPLLCALFVKPFPTLPAFAIFTVTVSCPHLITERGSSWRRGKRGEGGVGRRGRRGKAGLPGLGVGS